MFIPVRKWPDEREIAGFEIKRGVSWRIAYYAWAWFKIQLPMRYTGFVLRLKAAPQDTP